MTSRLPGFYRKKISERAAIVSEQAGLSPSEREALAGVNALTPDLADKLIENAVGIHGLPLGIAANFVVNGRERLIPMAIEEPSVVAGASYMAKLARETGGFRTSSTAPEMIGQIQILDLEDLDKARGRVLAHRDELLARITRPESSIVKMGGGPREIEVRVLEETAVGPMLVVHVIIDCRDAMGANLINTACETLAGPLAEITGGRVGLRILSNLADRRLARADCTIAASALATDDFDGAEVVRSIVEAWAFAAADPYRAATHNKGIMNGIDPVVIATGNDWRAIEAGAHAYAVRDGAYTSLSEWRQNADGDLEGSLELPMPVGIVGGTTRAHPTAQVALKILGVESASELAEIIVAVGLAQNLAALRALATEGIQKGHMALHARQIALSAGATGPQVDELTARMLRDGQISAAYAEQMLKQEGMEGVNG